MIFLDVDQHFNNAHRQSTSVDLLSTTSRQVATPSPKGDIECSDQPNPTQSDINNAICNAAFAINLAVGADDQNTQYRYRCKYP
jgi:hypothetical protein